MAFTQVSTSASGAKRGVRHEDNVSPDIWEVFRALRDARSVFGLKPGHIQTLQALLSFLRPGQGDTVFASNQEICRRIGGVDERTLRRHIDRFVDLGMIARHDSPNRKRYRVSSRDGQVISFGLSLLPLLKRAGEFLYAAAELEETRRDQIFLRKQILVGLAHIDDLEPGSTFADNARRRMRRKLAVAEYRSLLEQVTDRLRQMSTVVDVVITTKLPANDGQIVRHPSRSEKEVSESERAGDDVLPTVPELTAVCREATAFAPAHLRTWEDIERHAQNLAPMMGIQPGTFHEASKRLGSKRTAAAIFILLQLGPQVRNYAAYFHSITLGKRAASFKPLAILARLSALARVPV
ncbi:MAG: replication initiator RepC [Rubellimicrobium sp.]|nr:replication initiator RepC [Rubellimicrobium sp.]